MDQQNPSSHSLISSNLAAAAAAGFPSQLTAGLNNAGNVGQNPLFMSTLQHLGFATNPASSLLQSPQISLNGQFTPDLSNVSWNNQPSTSWFDQAKVAAMYNSMLQSTVNDHAQTQLESMVEQSWKVAAAAAAARAPPSISSAALNLASQHSNVNPFTSATMPMMAAAVAAATNPLSSLPNSFFSNVDSQPQSHHQQTITPMPQNQHIQQPNVTSVSATIVIPSSSQTNFVNMPTITNFADAFEIPKNSTFSNYGIGCGDIPSTSTQMINHSVPLKPSESFNVSSMISPQRTSIPTTKFNDILFPSSHPTPSSLPQNATSSNHVPLSLSPFQINQSIANTKDVNFDDLSMFDFNDLEMFPANKNSNSLSNIPAAFPSTSEIDSNRIIQPIDASISEFNNAVTPPLSSTKMTTKISRNEMDTDKELNHWLSLAVGGNLPPDEDPHGSPLSNFGETANDHMDLFSAETTGISLDPIMFTPPDSPTHNGPKDKSPIVSITKALKPGPSTSNIAPFPSISESVVPSPQKPIVESLIFMPKPKPKTEEPTKIPVYKQKKSIFSSSSITLEKALDKVVKSKKADEYNFTDDEEEEPKNSGFDFFSDDNNSDDQNAKSPSDAITKKKSVAESKPVASVEEVREEIKIERNNVAEVIKKRRELLKLLSHVFLYCETLDGDDAITPFASTSGENLKKESASESALSPEAMEIINENGEEDDDDEEYDSPPTLSSANGIPIDRIKSEIPDIINSPSHRIPDTQEVCLKEEPKESERILPKLVIKLRRESVTSPIPILKKKKKKHKKKKDDTDWEPTEKKRKKHKSKHRHHHHHHREGEMEASTNETISSALINSKPQFRFIHGNTGFNDPSVFQRLSYYGIPNGDSPKGTFVVCKQDIFKVDCPLWKIDNQNLLQKYPEVTENSGPKIYKNSSTYSGWCGQVAAGYLIVQVKYHRQSRAETIVEPMLPLIDLFPALSEVVGSANLDGYGLSDEPIFDDIFESLPSGSINITSAKTTVRSHMKAFTQAMLQHAASMNFLQSVKDSNDWDYLCALNEVENMTTLGKQRINDRIRWGQRFEVMLTVYANATISNEFIGEELCQACGDKIATKFLNLFSNESYNYDSLEIKDLPDIDGDSPLVAMQFCVCSKCASLALTYHQLHHMRYTTFRYCEDMIENMSTLRPDLPLDALITLCLNKRSWQRKLINEYAILWRKVQQNEL